MAQRLKVFLPRWTLAFVLPLLFVVWGVITYLAFFSPEGQRDFGLLGWIAATIVLALVSAMLWLMTGRLPAYIIMVEDIDEVIKR